MADEQIPDLEKEIAEVCDALDIDPAAIVHVVESNGQQFIGEFFLPSAIIVNDPENDGELTLEEADGSEDDDPCSIFINPLRILEEAYMDDEGNFQVSSFFIKYNQYTDDSFQTISKSLIKSIMPASNKAKMDYIISVGKEYYQIDEIELDDEETQSIQLVKTNVVDFGSYHIKRKAKQF